MAQTVKLWGATYLDVPAIDVPSSPGNAIARFTDTSITTAIEADVAMGKIFIKADGSQGTGTNQGGDILPDGDNIGYGNYVPAIVGQAIAGLSLVGEQTQPIVGTALAGLTQIGE